MKADLSRPHKKMKVRRVMQSLNPDILTPGDKADHSTRAQAIVLALAASKKKK